MVDTATAPFAEPAGAEAPAPVEAPSIPEKFQNEDGTLNQDALLKSYKEIESSKGKPSSEVPAEGEDAADDTPTEDAPKENTEDVPVATYGKAVDAVLTVAGLTPDGVNAEYQEKGGLSDETYSKLEAAGYGKEVVDNYVKGFEASAEDVKAMGDAQVKSIKDAAGGEKEYDVMLKWAGETLTQPEADTFNRLINSGDPDVAVAAATAMAQRNVNAEGKDANFNFGGATDGGDVFASGAAATKAMQEARASGDPAAIRAVEVKMLRSNVY